MLWGGLLMLASIVVHLSYLGEHSDRLSALLGGIGFGTFIDEVGKFVTQDNNYFYQPAIALIYVTFVLIYLAIRSLHRERPAAPEEYLVNALHEMENVAINDLDREERDRALSYLERSHEGDPLVVALKRLLARTDLVPTPDPPPLVRLRGAAVVLYRRLTARPEFPRVVVGFFVVQLILKVAYIPALLFWPTSTISSLLSFPGAGRADDDPAFSDWAQLASVALSAVFVLLGILHIQSSRGRALRMFQRSILVSIFITQVFMFYRDQWAALVALVFNLFVLAALNFAIDHESTPRAWACQG